MDEVGGGGRRKGGDGGGQSVKLKSEIDAETEVSRMLSGQERSC